jgi:alpha-tubulin suppressor-like RCC1 family protein
MLKIKFILPVFLALSFDTKAMDLFSNDRKGIWITPKDNSAHNLPHHVGDKVNLSGTICAMKWHNLNSNPKCKKLLADLPVKAYFPDATTEVTNQLVLTKKNGNKEVEFSFTTPSLVANSSNLFTIVVGNNHEKADKLLNVQAKLNKRILTLKERLIYYQNKPHSFHGRQMYIDWLTDFISNLERVSANINKALEENPNVLAQMSLPLQVENKQSGNFYYTSTFSGMKLAMLAERGLPFEGEKIKVTSKVTNLSHLSFWFPRLDHDSDDDDDVEDEKSLQSYVYSFKFDGQNIFTSSSTSIPLGESKTYIYNTSKLSGHNYKLQFEVKRLLNLKWPKGATFSSRWGRIDYDLSTIPDKVIPVISTSLVNGTYFNELPPFEFNIKDAFGQVDLESLKVFLNNVEISQKFSKEVLNLGSEINLRGNLNPINEGDYQIRIEAKDISNNTAMALSRDFYVDRTAPRILISNSDNVLTNQRNFSLSVTIDDSSPTQTVVSHNNLQTFSTNAQFFVSDMILNEGLNTFVLNAFDKAGNISQPFYLSNIVLDSNPPTLQELLPVQNSLLANTLFKLKAKFNEPLSVVKLNNQAVTIINENQIDENINLNGDGVYLFNLLVSDLANNIASIPISYEVMVKILKEDLISVTKENDGRLKVVGAVGSTRGGAEVTIDAGFFNNEKKYSNNNGSFEITLNTFSKATITVYDIPSGRKESTEIHYQGDPNFPAIDIANYSLVDVSATTSLPTDIIVENKATLNLPSKINYHYVPISNVIDIKDRNHFNGVNFGSSFAKIIFNYDSSKLSEQNLSTEFAVFYYDVDDETWKAVNKVVTDITSRTVTAYTNHFTAFVLTAIPGSEGGVPNAPSCITADYPSGIGGSGQAVLSTVSSAFKYYRDRDYFIKPLSGTGASAENVITFNALGLENSLGIATCNGFSGAATFDCGPANNHKLFSGNSYVEFTAHEDIDLYLMYDTRGGINRFDISQDAPWIVTSGFVNTGYFIETTDAVQYYSVYKKSYNKGDFVKLDGNVKGVTDPGIATNYWLIMKPKGILANSSANLLCVASQDFITTDPVKNAEAFPGKTSVTLRWENPKNRDFSGVVIRRSKIAPPANPLQGEEPVGTKFTSQSFRDTTALANTTYFYSIFSYDKNNNYQISSSLIAITGNDTDNDFINNLTENTYIHPSTLKTNASVSDTDSDGVIDGDEIAYGTDPTNPDISKPIVSSINLVSPAETSNLKIDFLINASDNIGITGWLITESGDRPISSSSDWLSIKPTSFNLNPLIGNGTRKIYVWVKDVAGNVNILSANNVVNVNLSEGYIKKLNLISQGACILTISGDVKCFSNSQAVGPTGGLLARLRSVNIVDWPKVKLPLRAIDIVSGANHTCAKLINNKYLCFGYFGTGDYGQMGDTDLTKGTLNANFLDSLNSVEKVVASGNCSCILYTNGSVKCFGQNLNGSIGQASTSSKILINQSVPLNFGERVVDIFTERFHTCVKLISNNVRCWGANQFGQLGYGHTNNIGDNELASSALNVNIGEPVEKMALGFGFTCALLKSGNVKCWGSQNNHGVPNVGNLGDNEEPVNIPYVKIGFKAVDIVATRTAVCVRSDQGLYRCWGLNTGGDLGNGSPETIGDNEDPEVNPVLDAGRPIKEIIGSVAPSSFCAVLDDSSVKCWGEVNKIVQGINPGNNLVPDNFGLNENLLAIPNLKIVDGFNIREEKPLATGSHSCVLTRFNEVKCWGKNNYGQIGLGHTQNVGDDELPKTTPLINTTKQFLQVTTGENHTCALTKDNKVVCWGGNNFGQLGEGHTQDIGDDEGIDMSIGYTPSEKVVKIDAGSNHTCLLTSIGNLKCWGKNNYGQLGMGHTSNIGDDELISSVPFLDFGTKKVIDFDSGNNFTCAVLNDFSVKCWGENNFGQLGLGDVQNRGDNELISSYSSVVLPTGVHSLAVGGNHLCVILDNLDTYCWGKNDLGQLGLGHTQNIGDNELPSAYGKVFHDDLSYKIFAGENHSCYLDKVKKLYCWGDNSFGQLGVGSTLNIGDNETLNVMNKINFVSDIIYLAVGGNTNCIKENNGGLHCWGGNNFGQLGIGSILNQGDNEVIKDAPYVYAFQRVKDISLNNEVMCALIEDGSVNCFGGKLNDNSINSAMGRGSSDVVGDDEYPYQAGPLDIGEPVKEVQVAYQEACALGISNNLYCWGRNFYGALGLGHTNVIGDDEKVVDVGPVPTENLTKSFSKVGIAICIIMQNDQIKCLGYNGNFALGIGGALNIGDDENAYNSPNVVIEPNAIQVANGTNHVCALFVGNQVKCWGANPYGEFWAGFGYNIIGDNETPLETTMKTFSKNIVKISVANQSTCVLFEDGSVKCWGRNEGGELGNGNTSGVYLSSATDSIPYAISIGSPAKDLYSAGSYTFCAVLIDNSIKCWGDNGFAEEDLHADFKMKVVKINDWGAFCALSDIGYVICSGMQIGKPEYFYNNGPDYTNHGFGSSSSFLTNHIWIIKDDYFRFWDELD